MNVQTVCLFRQVNGQTVYDLRIFQKNKVDRSDTMWYNGLGGKVYRQSEEAYV